MGADDYMVKLFDPSVLKIRIDNSIKTRAELKQRFSAEVEADVSTLTYPQVDIDTIFKVTILIEENIVNSDLTASFLCDTLGMSASKLCLEIKLLTDLAPNEFIRTVRFKKGGYLIKIKKKS